MDQVTRIREIAKTTGEKARQQLVAFQATGQKNLSTLRERSQKTLHDVESLARTTTEKAREQLGLFQAGEGAPTVNVASIREKGQKNLATIREKGQKTLHDVESLAKAQAARVKDETQKVVKGVQEQFKKEHLDELLSKLSAKDLIEKLRGGEIVEHGVNLRNELFEKLGIVLREDFEAALKRLDTLEQKVKDVAKKAAAAKKTTTPAA